MGLDINDKIVNIMDGTVTVPPVRICLESLRLYAQGYWMRNISRSDLAAWTTMQLSSIKKLCEDTAMRVDFRTIGRCCFIFDCSIDALLQISNDSGNPIYIQRNAPPPPDKWGYYYQIKNVIPKLMIDIERQMDKSNVKHLPKALGLTYNGLMKLRKTTETAAISKSILSSLCYLSNLSVGDLLVCDTKVIGSQ